MTHQTTKTQYEYNREGQIITETVTIEYRDLLPILGCATTRELLTELSVRPGISQLSWVDGRSGFILTNGD